MLFLDEKLPLMREEEQLLRAFRDPKKKSGCLVKSLAFSRQTREGRDELDAKEERAASLMLLLEKKTVNLQGRRSHSTPIPLDYYHP